MAQAIPHIMVLLFLIAVVGHASFLSQRGRK